MSEEYSVGYEEGYQAGWNAAIDAYTTPQPVSQEPFGWYSDKGGFNECGEGIPLYTAPQPVNEVELTDDEVWKIYGITGLGNGMALRFARAIEAKLKEKNT